MDLEVDNVEVVYLLGEVGLVVLVPVVGQLGSAHVPLGVEAIVVLPLDHGSHAHSTLEHALNCHAL